ncbi:MAG: hypothetical protein WCV62_00865 [Candidatus Peribacteraceae bacterium]|jgi:hypothetical protein
MLQKGTIDTADYYAITSDPTYVSFGRSFLEDVGKVLGSEDNAQVMRGTLETFLSSRMHDEYAAIFGFVTSNGHHGTVLRDALCTMKRHDVRSECGALEPMLDYLPPGAASRELRRAMDEILEMCDVPAEKSLS